MNCPICNSNSLKDVITFKNRPFAIFDKDLSTIDLIVSQCKDCNFLFQKSAYSKEYDELSEKVYKNYFIKGDFASTFPTPQKDYQLEIDFISNNIDLNQNINILEIGSSRGDLLYNLKAIYPNINILGIEPSNLEFVGVPTINSFFKKELFSNKFDFIIIRHVLEHIKNPKLFLKDIYEILNENGKLFIEVPNTYRDLIQKIELFTPDHVSYFTSTSISNLMKKTSFNIKNIDNNLDKHLFVFAEKCQTTDEVICDENINIVLKDYIESLNSISKELYILNNSGKKIVFYGASNLFIWAYSYINSLYKLTNIELIDDSNSRVNQTIFDLKVKTFDEINNDKDLVFVICSANRKIIQILTEKIKSSGFNKIFKPWSLLE